MASITWKGVCLVHVECVCRARIMAVPCAMFLSLQFIVFHVFAHVILALCNNRFIISLTVFYFFSRDKCIINGCK